jgi:DNA-directed RNA polymerase specialized sigma24 family protein
MADVTIGDLLAEQKNTNLLLTANARLLAVQLRATMKQNDLAVILADTGLPLATVAAILGTTSATVSNALVRTRKKAKGKATKKEITE